jgi:hypothetical protein
MPAPFPACRHCGSRNATRPRGLCRRCYYRPGLLALYPSTSKLARRGVGNGNRRAPLPDAPTSALPGTPEKVEVLCERARRHQQLFHPLDARLDAASDEDAA